MKVPDSRIIAAFQTHWQRLGAGSVPAREQFDPLDLPLILPNLLLVELEPDVLPVPGGGDARVERGADRLAHGAAPGARRTSAPSTSARS